MGQVERQTLSQLSAQLASQLAALKANTSAMWITAEAQLKQLKSLQQQTQQLAEEEASTSTIRSKTALDETLALKLDLGKLRAELVQLQQGDVAAAL